ncbi:NAD(P)-binding domain-containing protein [Microvirga rosea]|uniref:NAD(P)-binding domain-containing protein n=1 Tax=Microvirga rosea TaxID=2715425 RepID=UPI001D0B9EE1|nr:NAD(P)/FAD-dependent oxidoreductase [Microvirga rosea]MCB8821937.1 NAD(P)/FAD-dependent oxidoreductase [Microvirga rosea]
MTRYVETVVDQHHIPARDHDLHPSKVGLLDHEERVARDLEMLGYPAANWPAEVRSPEGEPVTDVVVVGAGMNGIAAAAALIFKGVRNVRVLDRNPAGREGPWLSFARMDTLRSPKSLPGPALGVPSLTFRAWYEAAFGKDAWEDLYKIPNAVWVGYLTWLQRVLSLPVEHKTVVREIAPAAGLLRIEIETQRGLDTRLARRVVLATGRGGAGGDRIPEFADRALWPDLAAHTNEAIDFVRLRGKSIAILGGGASAWDNAATALEQGAARVDMYVRRRTLPQINKGRGSASPGYFYGWGSLDDAERWSLFVYLNDAQAPPPHETVRRAMHQKGFNIHLGKPVEAAARTGQRVLVHILGEDIPREHDFLIVGTGFHVDAAAIPELGAWSRSVARWRDRYAPPGNLQRPDLGDFPYLGPGFELIERNPGQHPELSQIHLVNHGAALSHGAIASDIPGVNIAAERLATAIVSSLFREDLKAIRHNLEQYDEPELEGTPFFVRAVPRD